MEMCDDEIGVMDVHVNAQGSEEQAGQSAHRKKADEPAGVEHRSVEGNGALIKRGRPVENFDGRGNGDHVAQE